MVGNYFGVSTNNIDYTTVATITTPPFYQWTYISINISQPFRYIRYFCSACAVAELLFSGILLNVVTHVNTSVSTTNAVEYCAVSLNIPLPANDASMGPLVASSVNLAGNATKNVSGLLPLSVNLTGVVQGVTPQWGTALGGDIVTIFGNFPYESFAGLNVSINGVFVNSILSANGSVIVVITAARDAVRESTVIVFTNEGGYTVTAPNAILFMYLDRWSASTTWAYGEFPVFGDTVIVPVGQAILLDVSPPQLKLLLVQGTLIWDRVNGLELQASYIIVSGGTFEIGTESRPFLQKATITLHGDRFTLQELPEMGAKCLIVTNSASLDHTKDEAADPTFDAGVFTGYQYGVLDIHGAPRRRVWCKVAITAFAGDTSVTLSEEVDFDVGDLLIITSSSVDMFETEELIVTGRSEDNLTISFKSPLQYTHVSEWYTVGDEVVDLRVEVGIISRNVVIQSDPAESNPQEYGFHSMALHGGIYRTENAEYRFCGQAFVLGRYCIHFHEALDESKSYVRGNSIHHSFQRAVVTHSSHNVRVQHNVAYKVFGHTFFVEDGNEQFNLFEENLGVFTMASPALLKSDLKPATFWTASPNNIWRNNVAAGSDHDGFWLELSGHPGGSSFVPYLCPVGWHIIEWFNNTAHSNGVHGLRIYPTYTPLVRPCDSTSGSAPQYFINFTSWRNGGNGIFGKLNGDLHHINAKLVENNGEELAWMKFKVINYSNNPNVHNLLAVGSRDFLNPKTSSVGILLPGFEFFYVSGATFVNYAIGAISGCFNCATDGSFRRQGGYTVRFDGLTFVNTSKRVKWLPPYKDIFSDLDGSLTSHINGTTMPFFKFNDVTACLRSGAIPLDSGSVCDASVRVRRLQIDNVSPVELNNNAIKLISKVGAGLVMFDVFEINGWVAPIVTEQDYTIVFMSNAINASTIDFETMRLRYSEPPYLSERPLEFVFLSFPYIDYHYAFAVTPFGGTALPPLDETGMFNMASNTTNSVDCFGTGRLNSTGKTWSVMLNMEPALPLSPYPGSDHLPYGDLGPYAASVQALLCQPGRCSDITESIPLGPPQLWSIVGPSPCPVNLTVPGGTYLLMDVQCPPFQSCVIIGKLEFVDTQDLTLTCNTVLLLGQLQIGSELRPFIHNARISLQGTRTSPVLVVSPTLFLGNKMMAVFGDLILHGAMPAVPWTRLAVTLNIGDSILTTVNMTNWKLGMVVTVTPTEYDIGQEETFTIIEIINQTRFRLDHNATFRHYAGLVSNGNGGFVQLAAGVGMLTRNIVVDGSSIDGYGAHIFVGDVAFTKIDNTISYRTGSASVSAVEFTGTGKRSSQYPSVTLHYQQVFSHSNYPTNSWVGCSFKDVYGAALEVYNTSLLIFQFNVLQSTFRSGVLVNRASSNIYMDFNFMAANRYSTDKTFMTLTTQPQAGFFIDTPSLVSFQGNLVAGCVDAGFTLIPPLCNTVWGNKSTAVNEAMGTLIGVFLLSYGGDGCRWLANFQSWKNAHISILTVAQTSNIRLNNIVISDSHIGVSLNYFRGNGVSIIENSIILGTTPASANCVTSKYCRASSATDPGALLTTSCMSVFGNAFRRVGFTSSQYTNRGKTCDVDGFLPVCNPSNTPIMMCSMPWEKRYGLPSAEYAEFRFKNTVFSFFNETDCGLRSVVYHPNPSNPDMVPTVFFENITFANILSGAMFDLGGAVSTQASAYSMVVDVDGSVEGVPLAVFISDTNPTLASNTCVPISARGSLYCPVASPRMLVLTNVDSGEVNDISRIFGPVRATLLNNTGNRTVFGNKQTDDGCAMRFFKGQYQMALPFVNMKYNFTLTQSPPNNLKISYYSTDPQEAVILHFFYTQPFLVAVVANGIVVASSNLAAVTLSASAGTNFFDAQERHLTVLLRGGATTNLQEYFFRIQDVIQVTIAVVIKFGDFFNPLNLVYNIALLLNIPSSQIKNVRVGNIVINRRRNNSTSNYTTGLNNISFLIVDSTGIPTTQEAAAAQAVRMAALANQVTNISSSGLMAATLATTCNVTVVGLLLVPPTSQGPNALAVIVPIAPTTIITTTSPPSTTGTTGNPPSSSEPFAPWILGVAGTVVLLAILYVGIRVLHSKSRSSNRVTPRVDPPMNPLYTFEKSYSREYGSMTEL